MKYVNMADFHANAAFGRAGLPADCAAIVNLRPGTTRSARSTWIEIEIRGQRLQHSDQTARFTRSATGRPGPYRSTSAAKSTLAR